MIEFRRKSLENWPGEGGRLYFSSREEEKAFVLYIQLVYPEFYERNKIWFTNVRPKINVVSIGWGISEKSEMIISEIVNNYNDLGNV